MQRVQGDLLVATYCVEAELDSLAKNGLAGKQPRIRVRKATTKAVAWSGTRPQG